MWTRLLEPLRGNPVLTRHLATTFTGPRLGVAFLLVTGALVALYGILFLEATYYRIPEGIPYFSHNVTLLGLLLLLLPLKVSGIIEGPRINRSFDQIVATGVPPATLYLGAWISGLAYATVLLFVTLPFAACLVVFGGAEIGLMLRGYVTLLAYSNVIIAVTLAASVFGREWITAPVAITVLAVLSVFAVIPDRDWVTVYPGLLAELSPLRLFIVQAGIVDSDFLRLVRVPEPALLLWSWSPDVVRPLLWGGVMLAGALLVHIGPGHRFTPGFDVFGTVVLAGDRKRGLLGRLRGGVTRRVEMAFFYENAPPWTHRWGFLIRYALVAAVVVLGIMLVIAMIWSWDGSPGRRDVFADEKAIVSLAFGYGLVALWACLSSNGRSHALAWLPVGSGRIRSELLYVGLFAVLAGLLLWFESLPVARIEDLAAQNKLFCRGRPMGTAAAAMYVANWWALATAATIVLANMFLIARVASRVTDNFYRVRILVVLCYVALLVLPAVLAVAIHEGIVSPAFLPIASLSFVVLYPEFNETWLPGQGWEWLMMAHGVLAGVLIVLFVSRYVWFPRRRVAAVAAVALGLCGPGDLPGQEPQAGSILRIEHVARGFDGVVFADGVDFYTVVIRNTGTATVMAELRVDEFEHSWGRREFVLSPGAARTLRLAAEPFDRLPRWRRRSGGGDTRVVLRCGAEIVRSEPLDLIVSHDRHAQTRGKKAVRAEQHLFVGALGALPQPWLQLAFASNAQNLSACAPQDMPVSARSFDGLELVWMTASALSQLDPQQQTALLHYVLLGGTVVFSAALPGAEVTAAGCWQELVRPEEEWTSTFDGTQLRHARFSEGSDLVTVGAGEAQVPVLHARHAGAGTIAHMAFPPVAARMPPSLRADAAFWQRFDSAIQRGRFPLVGQGLEDLRAASDYSWLAALGGFYVVYALLISVGLFLFARRRRQRRRMWTLVFGLPVLFLALVPLLVSNTERQVSVAEHAAVSLFHAGSTRGVRAGHVLVHSSGKQHHELGIRGRMPLVFAGADGRWRYRHYRNVSRGLGELRPLPLRPVADGRWQFGFDVKPWTTGEIMMFDVARLEEPVWGRARVGGKNVAIEATIPAPLRGRRAFVIMAGDGGVRSKEVDVDAAGNVALEFVRGERAKGRLFLGHGSRSTLQAHRRFALNMIPQGPTRVYLALAPADLHAGRSPVQSEDLSYQREVSRRTVEHAVEHRSQPGVPELRVREEDGRFIETMDHELLVFELEVESGR